MEVIFAPILIITAISIYFSPAIIAYTRKHEYKLIILGLNAIGFVGIFPWIIAFIWAAWPKEKSIIDPLVGNVTGTGRRNVGDTLGSTTYGLERGFTEEAESSRNQKS